MTIYGWPLASQKTAASSGQPCSVQRGDSRISTSSHPAADVEAGGLRWKGRCSAPLWYPWPN